MSYKITTRIVPAVILLSLLGTGMAQAQAFCFLKDNDRRANFNNGRMPAIGFNPAGLQGYLYSPVQPVRYGNPGVMPRQLPYDKRYGAGTGLQR